MAQLFEMVETCGSHRISFSVGRTWESNPDDDDCNRFRIGRPAGWEFRPRKPNHQFVAVHFGIRRTFVGRSLVEREARRFSIAIGTADHMKKQKWILLAV